MLGLYCYQNYNDPLAPLVVGMLGFATGAAIGRAVTNSKQHQSGTSSVFVPYGYPMANGDASFVALQMNINNMVNQSINNFYAQMQYHYMRQNTPSYSTNPFGAYTNPFGAYTNPYNYYDNSIHNERITKPQEDDSVKNVKKKKKKKTKKTEPRKTTPRDNSGSLDSLLADMDTSKANTLVEKALENKKESSVGECGKHVSKAIEATMGNEVSDSIRAEHAYQMADKLAKNSNFQEISISSADDFRKLPKGCIVVYGQGVGGYSTESGHIAITVGPDEDGFAVSDFLQQYTGNKNHYGNNDSELERDLRAGRIRVFIPINKSIDVIA